MPEPAIGQIGDRYQLTDVIGRGGMGIVYRGFDVTMSRQVAIKMLHGFDAEDKETVLARFLREVTSLAALQHKNIVTIYTFEQHEGKPYMVMEYLEGKSLQEIVTSKEAIEMTEKLNLMVQVCDGLQYAHENGLIHRDIKPANILVLKNGTAKLIDFGIARAGLNQTLTQPGQVIGSLSYMSPEQISNHALDARTDVFSAGVVLFQLLTGQLPFEGSDMAGTISKILNAPSPPLGDYISDYPKELDQIVARALAKKADERYQSAEEFGFDLSKVLETLKRGLAGEMIRRAKVCIEKQDWEAARQQLQEVRKIDRLNDVANEMFQIVTREIQRQQKATQVALLRSQAQFALLEARYEEALECIEQGLRIDEGDTETLALREVVKQRAKRAQDLDEALRRSQAAFYAGDLAEAQSAIDQALAIEPEHTEARTLGHLIKREVSERSKRVQLQGFIDAARAEIGKKNFVEALQFIQKAKEIDPSDTSIQELLAWASRGYTQEKTRKELEKNAGEIGRLLQEDRYQEALSACDAALTKFPQEVSLLKLRELATRQRETQSRRQAVEEISNNARAHADAGEHEKALRLLENALQTYPGEASLETLLAIARSDRDLKQREEAELEEFRKISQAQKEVEHSPVQEDAEVLDLLQSFRIALAEKASLSGLREIAERLASLAANGRLGPAPTLQYRILLAEFEERQTKLSQDLAQLESLRLAISTCNAGAEMARLLERSRFLNELYPSEERFADNYRDILQYAHVYKQKRDSAVADYSTTVRAMQATEDLSQLSIMHQRLEEASKNWPDDADIRGLASQASARIEEVRAHKRRILEELAQIEGALAGARSIGQLRLMEEQARALASDLVSDSDVEDVIRRMSQIAQAKLQLLNGTCSALKELMSKISNAETLEKVDNYARDAERVASEGVNFEETEDLLRKIRRLIDERRKDYIRIERNLQLLIESSVKATGPAELDLILARRRDLVKKYPSETCFLKLYERLEASVGERRLHLAEVAASEEKAENPPEALGEESELVDLTSSSESKGPQAQLSQEQQTAAVSADRIRPRGTPQFWVLLAGGLLAVSVAAFYIVPKTSSIKVDPATALIQVDGRSCQAPCSVRLMPGSHELVATQPGFEELHQIVKVPWGGGELPTLVMRKNQELPLASVPTMTESAIHLGGAAKIIVNTSLPGALVFVDNARAGITGNDGSFDFVTKAGPHQVRVEKSGFLPVLPMNMRLEKDQAATVYFSFTPTPPVDRAKNDVGHSPSQTVATTGTSLPTSSTLAAPQSAPDSFIVLKAPAGAEVHIDQQSRGQSTGEPYRIKVEPGQRTIEVFLAGYQTWKQTQSVDPGKEVNLVATLTPAPAPTTAANPPILRPSSGVSDDDRKQIQQLLDRYATAVTHKDVKQLHALFPDIPKDQLKIVKELPSGFSIALSVTSINVLEGSETAVVKCKQVSQSNAGKSEDNVVFYLGKLNTGWIVTQIPRSN
jgi:serine/threonine-protein kinase